MLRIDRPTGNAALNSRSGFTLPEAMVASTLSIIVFLILFAGLAFSRQMIANARYHNEAEALAMDQALWIFNAPYTNITSQSGVVTTTVPTNSMLYPLGGTIRTGVVVYTNYSQIQVRVDWKFLKWGVTNNPSESLWINRRDTWRGGL